MKDKPDYELLIDQEVWAFIRDTHDVYANTATSAESDSKPSVTEQRQLYNALCRKFARAVPASVSFSDSSICTPEWTVPIRRYSTDYRPAHALLMYFHGGGFVLGDLNSHHEICAELCAATHMPVTSVDYRLSPEHKHPAAFYDCIESILHEAAQNPDLSLILCGDSAGANLAAAAAHQLRQSPIASRIVGQLLIYPELGGNREAGSYLYHADAPMLSSAEIEDFLLARAAGELPINDVRFSPLQDSDFTRLPKTVVFVAECDPLADDGRNYCDAITGAGGSAKLHYEKGLVHGYLRARYSCARAAASFQAMIDELNSIAVSTLSH